MNAPNDHRGGATVGHLHDYDAVTAAAVIYLRMWCDSPETQAGFVTDLTGTLGIGRGHKAVEAFAELCSICARHGRRPLTRHGLHCKCVGADEASFGHFIATAAEGEREDAMLIAILLVRPDMASIITGLAADFGVALKQMNLAAPRAMAQTSFSHHTLH
ncbi:hypothetical protein [Loktanella sp. Alg231-35]|uniref:hypothetical protein n=1 Tax=Loktanella sp. Alg231-35 TaxID=1922220 RepID=UPI000D561D99|nr:hypothetical protein [Loktanella sp. Alg231-35]